MSYRNTQPTPSGILPRHAAALCKRTAAVIAGTLLASLILLAFTTILAPQALRAGTHADGAEAPMAGLFFRTGRAEAVLEAPTLRSDVHIRVSGQVARVKVRQRFRNPSKVWLEGIYVFPLPERSAVDRLIMTVGDRRVEGRIMERAAAERVYREAAAAGKRASLLSSERPNVFVVSVANVGPGDEVVVEIEYQDRVAYRDGRFDLRFPMVVAPRYTPPAGAAPLVKAPLGPPPPRVQPIAVEPMEPPEDAGRDLFGPVRRPSEQGGDGQENRLSLVVELDPGLPIAELRSVYHDILIEARDAARRIVTLADRDVAANRDFLLTWRPAVGAAPEAAIFAEEIAGDSYLMVSLLPPQGDAEAAPRIPRDLVFVVDTSGSMHGPSLAQAQKALLLALDRLRPEDRFNVIRFDSETAALFRRARPADAENIRRAKAYVEDLEADGGTEMRPALELALRDAPEPGRLRQVVFLTDGAVGNERQLFRIISERLAGNRLFTIGIGSAPNAFFMRKVAQFGRGGFTYIGEPGEVAERMSALFRKLERPALTDVTLAWPRAAEASIEMYPARLPDLYADEPVSFTLRLAGVPLADLAGELTVGGRRGGETWRRRLALDELGEAVGVAAIWGRAKFADIQDGLTRGRDPARVRAEALAVALKHRLVTRYTSLVAVDDEVVRPADAPLASREVPRELPEGWDYGKVFGAAQEVMDLRSLPAPLLREASLQSRAISLPQTATPALEKAMIGLGLISLGGFFLLVAGRFRRARGA